MTERKPPGVTFDSWIDKQIRTAQERGDFDDLPGAGKPLPGAGAPLDDHWWVKEYIRREGLSGDALLPAPLQVRKEVERLPETVRDLTTEQEVRDVAADLNRRIVEYLRAPTGPQVAVGPVNVDDVVARWRADRPDPQRRPASAPNEPVPRKTHWWQRFRR
ncbi:DnaJ family domain-containing protein [Saccharopolyspora hattusasensis]|uniref:DnaJ family domain-containing protein n=1 Tax=Saccharopolyspora hattusasensis TaxID=1128679 RepID=UPI003D951398